MAVVEDLEVVLTLVEQEIHHQHHHHKEVMVGTDSIILVFLLLVALVAALVVLVKVLQMQTHHLELPVGVDLHLLSQELPWFTPVVVGEERMCLAHLQLLPLVEVVVVETQEFL